MKKLTERFKKNDNQEETQVIKEEKELIKQKNENEVPALIPFESRNDRVGRIFKY